MASSEHTKAADTNADSSAHSKAHADAHAHSGLDQERSAADQAKVSDLDRLRMEATINGRYHTSRQGWYELMHRLSMFVVVIGGAGAVAEAVGSGSKHSWMIALIPTIAGTVDLVFDFSAKAALHARLQEKSYEIVADIEQSTDEPAAVCRRGWAGIARICALETKTMRVVHALAYNDTKEGAQEDVQGDLLIVPLWARFLKHLWPFDGLRLYSAKDTAAKA